MSSVQGAGSPKPEKSKARKRRRSQSRGPQARYLPGHNLAGNNRAPASVRNRAPELVPEGYKPASHEEYVQRYIVPTAFTGSDSENLGTQILEAAELEKGGFEGLQAETGSRDPAEGRRPTATSELANAQQIKPRYTNSLLPQSTNNSLSQSTIHLPRRTSALRPDITSLPQTVSQHPYSNFLPQPTNRPNTQSFASLQPPQPPQPPPQPSTSEPPSFSAVHSDLTMSAPPALSPPGAYSSIFPTAQLAQDYINQRNSAQRPALQNGDVIPPEGARHNWCRVIYDAIVQMAGAEPLSTSNWVQGNAPQQFLEALAVQIVHNIIAIYTDGPRVFLEYPFVGIVSYFEPNIRLGDRLEAVRAVLHRHKDYCLHLCNGSGLQHLVHAPRALMASLNQSATTRYANLQRARQAQLAYAANAANPTPYAPNLQPHASPYQASSSSAPGPGSQQHRGSYQPPMGSALSGPSRAQNDFAVDPSLGNRAASTSHSGGRPAPRAPARPDESIYGAADDPAFLERWGLAERAAAEALAASAGLAAPELQETEPLEPPGPRGAAPAAGEEKETGGEDWRSFLNEGAFEEQGE
ncbi:uncharacterized protein BDZ99DRAFT_528113 [Mytilinidion resinicola]|uniref:Uncharacterized protein n=1 Tax=Mytilinidion resinicola TaxID=574789 RepID=A0A6A6XZ25_9PEZI|nr:uncharacterized protein BDZ99DRAFT_528113 [Mytilinidion resinicola]KAF2801639.1 hypothetical protein BDZ99DRAFT_528113 [Mytilinidion resinicola]